MEFYLDTNVLVYAAHEAEAAKCAVARNLLLERGCISLIGVNEFCNVSIKKHKTPVSQIQRFIDLLLDTQSMLPIDKACVYLALTLHERYRYAYFDARHLAIALRHNVPQFLSEDMQDGAEVAWGGRSLRIRNPFAGA